MNLIINTDGASRGNPGPSSYGFAIVDADSKKVVYEEGKVIENGTNNVAEYMAVLKALEYVYKNLPHDNLNIKVVADSLLIVQQLYGKYKVKHPKLLLLHQEIKSLEVLLGVDNISYHHVYRENNTIADRLANEALDKKK